MNPALVFVLLVFASARLTRLAVTDTVTLGARTWLIRHSRRQPWKWAAAVTSCSWCTGVYFAAALVAVVWAFRPLPLPWLWIPAVAGAQMLVNGIDLRLDTH